MYQAVSMSGGEAGGDLAADPQHDLRRGLASALQPALQRQAPEVFHGQEQDVVVSADVVNRHDVIVLDRGRGLRFADEATLYRRCAGQRRLDHFHGDKPGELRVLGEKDKPDASLADQALDPVMRQPAEFAVGLWWGEEVDASQAS